MRAQTGKENPRVVACLPFVEQLARPTHVPLARDELRVHYQPIIHLVSGEVTRRNSEAYFRTLVQSTADVILICVPTPVTDGAPDLTAVRSAGAAVGNVLTPDTLVVLESTTYPGTTDEILRPLRPRPGAGVGARAPGATPSCAPPTCATT